MRAPIHIFNEVQMKFERLINKITIYDNESYESYYLQIATCSPGKGFGFVGTFCGGKSFTSNSDKLLFVNPLKESYS